MTHKAQPTNGKTFVRSKITHATPGLTEGKTYEVLNWGFFRGAWVEIINDRGEKTTIRDALTYLDSVPQ